jgi:hypothetical protein
MNNDSGERPIKHLLEGKQQTLLDTSFIGWANWRDKDL